MAVIKNLSGNADSIHRLFDSFLEKIRFVWSCRWGYSGSEKSKKCWPSCKATH